MSFVSSLCYLNMDSLSKLHSATGGDSVDEEDAVDVDALAVDGGTEAEGVARAPARRDDAFPIKN